MKSFLKHIENDSKRSAVFEKKGLAYSKAVAAVIKKRTYDRPESALAIAGDLKYQSGLKKKLAPFGCVQNIILIGIGGSSLGAEAVYAALAFKTSSKLHVIDAIEKDSMQRFKELISEHTDLGSFAVVVASKSGTTTETLTNAAQALDHCTLVFGKDAAKRFIFVGTDGSEFLKRGKRKGVACLSFPESIGGRFSVFTAAGLVPLMLANIDVQSFCEGGMQALAPEEKKESLKMAYTLASLAEKGYHTVNFFTFNDRLRLLGFWYRQLLAESIGKTMTTSGATFCHQLLPTVSTSVDLHSMAQLYLGGYRGMFTHFLYIDEEGEHHKLSGEWLLDHVPMLKDKTPQNVKEAIRSGVLRAYDDQKLPYRLTHFNKMSAYELGYIMASLMFEVMCLGNLLDVDPFTQPSVESYKMHTRTLLAGT